MAMLPTHLLVGVLIGSIAGFFSGDLVLLSLVGGLGGSLSDLDSLFVHRRTLHFPHLSVFLVLLSIPLVYYSYIPLVFSLSLMFHSWLDYFGSGSVRPWEEDEIQEGLYSHLIREWLVPKGWLIYGSKEDVGLCFVLFCAISTFHFMRDSLIVIISSFLVFVIGLLFYLLREKITKIGFFERLME